MSKCEFENERGNCTLNECMYQDFDDSVNRYDYPICYKPRHKKPPYEEESASIVDKNIIKAAVKKYGNVIQSCVCMEECAELIQAISKEIRGESNKAHLAEEMADVIICIATLKEIYGIEESKINTWITKKQKRMNLNLKGESHES